MRTICISIYLLSLLLSSCQNKEDNSAFFANFSILKNAREGSVIYIIPGAGCTGCISSVESLALTSQKNDSLYFIFTKINSFKLFNEKFHREFKVNQNIIIDTLDKFKYPDEELHIYPIIYKKKNGYISFVQYLKP